jgi:CSLREA domain-containing protein
MGIRAMSRPTKSVSRLAIAMLALAASSVIAVVSAPRAFAAVTTFTVNSVDDGADDVPGNHVCHTAANTCSLRAAMTEANSDGGPTTINFNIAGAAPHTIAVGSALPEINDSTGGTTIDGYTEPGSSANTDPLVDNAVLTVQVQGTGSAGIDGLFVASASNVIKGLALFQLHRAIWINGAAAHDNQVIGNFIGIDAAGGSAAVAPATPGASGVVLQHGTTNNLIGTPAVANRNVISGNPHQGVAFYEPGTTGNKVQNNIIGLNPAATAAIPNLSHGVDINEGASSNLIGGTGAGERNVLSGNAQEGAEISHDTTTQLNQVVGNFIGTDPTGNAAQPFDANGTVGVFVEGFADCGSSPCPADIANNSVTDNVIGNNPRGGIFVHKGAVHSTIARNRIGVSLNGTPIGNGLFGLRVESGSQYTMVANNVIAFNQNGVQVDPMATTPPGTVPSPTNFITFTQNSIHDNGIHPGIDLAPLNKINPPGGGDPNVNQGINSPVLRAVFQSKVIGSACGGCKVEIFVADGTSAAGSGATYVGTVTAGSDGNFSAPVSLSSGQLVTATATDGSGNTSEFSRNVRVSSVSNRAYWTVASDGGIFAFGDASFAGSTGGIHLARPVVGMAASPAGGYWLVASDGGVFAFGNAAFAGSTGGQHLNAPVVGMASTPDGGGYWLVASDGGVFSFGNATFFGSTGGQHLNAPIVGMVPTADGGGYWLVASDGGIFNYGNAGFFGSAGGIHLNRPVQGMAATPTGSGYWLVATDGGIFAYGDAGFFGSMGGQPLNSPVVGMAATPAGYWLVASDGGIFSFGDSTFVGSTGGIKLNQPIVGMSALPT